MPQQVGLNGEKVFFGGLTGRGLQFNQDTLLFSFQLKAPRSSIVPTREDLVHPQRASVASGRSGLQWEHLGPSG